MHVGMSSFWYVIIFEWKQVHCDDAKYFSTLRLLLHSFGLSYELGYVD